MTINTDCGKDDFNKKFRNALSDLVLREDNSSVETIDFGTKKNYCEIFVYLSNTSLSKDLESLSLNDEVHKSIVSINEIRVLLLTNFLAKILNKRYSLFKYY